MPLLRKRTLYPQFASLIVISLLLRESESQSGAVSVPCSEQGSTRLVGGAGNHTGRVELCSGDEWTQVCDNNWSLRDAEVVCRQLDYTTLGAQAYGKSFFGSGFSDNAFTNFHCTGTEDSVYNCDRNYTTSSCAIDEHAGVVCQARPPGRCEAAGHRTCCLRSCMVVGPPICYCDSNCLAFNDCCDDFEHICPQEASSDCTNEEVRLVGGATSDEGRVEVCVGGQWSTICDDLWNREDAEVVCKQLGHNPLDARAHGGALFGQGNTSILLSSFQCNGSEANLTSCNYTAMSVDCGHQREAGVTCASCINGNVRLASGNSLKGQVEVCGNQQWNTVCDSMFNDEAAGVVCRQLGHSQFAQAISGSGFSSLRYPPLSVNVQCDGNETMITECSLAVDTEPGNCTNNDTDLIASVQCANPGECEKAGLIHCCTEKCKAGSCYCDSACSIFGDCCSDTSAVCSETSCTMGNIRLIHGRDDSEGILRLCVNDQMGLVCGTNWSTEEARVLCKSIGQSYTGAQPANLKYFTSNTSLGIPVVGGEFNCTGDEDSLLDCAFSSTPSCGVDDAVGVVCESACSDGDLRLVNGSSSYEGRVEVCVDGEWGTVCDEQWTTRDAEVICRQLGYSAIDAQAFGGSYYYSGLSARPIHFTGALCTGSEDDIRKCPISNLTAQCSHSQDAGVRCSGPIGDCQKANFTSCCTLQQGCNVGSCFCDEACHDITIGGCCNDVNITCPLAECEANEIRLVDGPTSLRGRVEVCVDGRWSTVCGEHWDVLDARVVCNQLGNHTTDPIAYSNAVFGQGSVLISIGGLNCTATEQGNILNCAHSVFPDCSHSQDVGVSCEPANCTDGDVRLVGGEDEFEGNVEVCRNGSWTGVCDSQWSNLQASVVCRQLGFQKTDASGYMQSFFAPSINPPGLTNFQCTKSEQSLTNCLYSTAVENCTIGTLAGVRCAGPLDPCQIADHCCSGNCTETINGTCYCKAECISNSTCCSDIDTICPQNNTICNESDVMLVDGSEMHNGRVEICLENKWQTICDKSWDSNDAQVVCGELGFTTYGAQAVFGGHFPVGFGPIGLSDIDCTGSEDQLLECDYLRVNLTSTCLHQNDAGVMCALPCNNGELRIVGTSSTTGHVELCIDSDWVSVCASNLTTIDAAMVCSILGFPTQGGGSLIQLVNASSVNHAPNIIDASACSNSSSLQSCSAQLNASCSQLFGVTCQEPCPEGEVRLTGGTDAMEGLVEVCRGGVFGALCDETWCDANARVVCGQLGYSRNDVSALRGSSFNSSNITNIHSYNFQCSGTELSTSLCRNTTLQACDKDSLAGVQCRPKTMCEVAGHTGCCSGSQTQCAVSIGPNMNCYCDYGCYEMNDCCDGIDTTCPLAECDSGDLDLVGGNSSLEGYVQFCSDGRLGMICSDHWSNEEAMVVCQMLGLPFTGATVDVNSLPDDVSNASFVAGEFSCSGAESNLTDCAFNRDFCCQSNQPAPVLCQAVSSSFDPSSTTIVTSSLTMDDDDTADFESLSTLVPTVIISATSIDMDMSDDISETIVPITESFDSLDLEPSSVIISPSFTENMDFTADMDSTADSSDEIDATTSSQPDPSSDQFSEFEMSTIGDDLVPYSTPFASTVPQSTTASSSSSSALITTSLIVTATPLSTSPLSSSAQLFSSTQSTTSTFSDFISPSPVTTESVVYVTTEKSDSVLSTSVDILVFTTTFVKTSNPASASITSTSISPPPEPPDNIVTVTVVLRDHNTMTFTGVAERFKVITAEALNEFCDRRGEECTSVVLIDRRRQTGGTNFSSEDIVIADTTDTSCGVEVDFYARVGNGAGIVPRNALEQSTREAIQSNQYDELGDVMLLSDIFILPTLATIVISVLGGTLLVAVILVITISTIQCYRRCTRTKVYHVEQTDPPRPQPYSLDTSLVIENQLQNHFEGLPQTFVYNEKSRCTQL